MTDKKKEEAKEHLEGFDIRIDPFGNISSNMNIDKVNEFLDKNVEDKKLHPSSEEE